MNIKVNELMAERVVTAHPNDTVAHARTLMERESIHAVPIVDGDGELAGIVTTADLVHAVDGSAPLSRVMSRRVTTVPQYHDISAAAGLMRKRRIHHLVVTHEKRIVGILSSYDLLEVVERHRFSMRKAPARRGGDDGGR